MYNAWYKTINNKKFFYMFNSLDSFQISPKQYFYTLEMRVLTYTIFPMYVYGYILTDSYNYTNFFDKFNFITSKNQPGVNSGDTVSYVDFPTAWSAGLAAYTPENKIYIGVDSTTFLSGNEGRSSVRLSSKVILNGNVLVVLDMDHMPTTVGKVLPKGCSIWPAFWTFGPG